jgi:hypothetical protein
MSSVRNAGLAITAAQHGNGEVGNGGTEVSGLGKGTELAGNQAAEPAWLETHESTVAHFNNELAHIARSMDAMKLSFARGNILATLGHHQSNLVSDKLRLKSINENLMRWAFKRDTPSGLIYYENTLRDVALYSDRVAQGRCRVYQLQEELDAFGPATRPFAMAEESNIHPLQRQRSENRLTKASPSLVSHDSTSDTAQGQAELNDTPHPFSTDLTPTTTSFDVPSPPNDPVVSADVNAMDIPEQPAPSPSRSRPTSAIRQPQRGPRGRSIHREYAHAVTQSKRY